MYNVTMSVDDDLAWLHDLQESLWPPGHKNDVVSYVASRLLTQEEFTRIEALIESMPLVTMMFSANMFGGYGMSLLTHEDYPGTGPQPVLSIFEGHFPNPLWVERPTVYDRLLNPDLKTNDAVHKKPGSGRDDIWNLFSKYTHSEKNRAWLKSYQLRAPQSRVSYDY